MEDSNFFEEAVELFNNMEAGETAVSSDNSILIQQLHKGDILNVYLLASSSMPTAQRGKSIIDLRNQIADHFNLHELRALCFELEYEFEDLAGEGKSPKCLSLVDTMRRHGRLQDLISLLKKQRPHVAWPKADQITLPTIIRKDDLAVVVGMIHRRGGGNVLQDAASYLAEQGTDANILFFVTSGEISIEADWQQFPQTFRDVIGDTFSQAGAKTGHFFLASTGAILFSMGCIWSTIERSVIYHKQHGQGYHPVITLPL